MHHSALLRTFLIFSLFIVIADFCYGQNTEIRANAYSGIFFFRGNGSTRNSTVGISDMGYYNPVPYGKKSSFSFSLELQTQRVTKQKHLFGAGISFENLKSREGIDSIGSDIGTHPETGKVILSNTFITINPFVGQRFVTKKITFDVLAGIDIAFCTKVHEDAKITSNNDFTYSINKANHPVDFRPRIQVNANFKRVGLLIGYSLGLINLYYNNNTNYLNKKAYTNFLRFGISYRLK